MSSEQRLLILGLGNILLGDDGVGIHIIHELKNLTLPDFVSIVDGGTMGIGIIEAISGYQEVLVVDAVKGEGLPDLKFFSPDKVIYKEKNLSLHSIGLDAVLRLMDTLDIKVPEISILGIRPERITHEPGLSTHCCKMIPQALGLIMGKIEEYAVITQ